MQYERESVMVIQQWSYGSTRAQCNTGMLFLVSYLGARRHSYIFVLNNCLKELLYNYESFFFFE